MNAIRFMSRDAADSNYCAVERACIILAEDRRRLCYHRSQACCGTRRIDIKWEVSWEVGWLVRLRSWCLKLTLVPQSQAFIFLHEPAEGHNDIPDISRKPTIAFWKLNTNIMSIINKVDP